MRLIFLLSLLIVTSQLVAQKRFMIGISVNPGISSSTIHYAAHSTATTINNSSSGSVVYNSKVITYQSQTIKYSPAFAMGAGLDFGVYLSSRFFLLTGVERTVRVFGYNAFTNSKITYSSWEIPLLANYIVTNKDKKVSLFISGGFAVGAYTSQVLKIDGQISQYTYLANPSNDLYYINAVVGLGCKINVNERLSLLVIPNFAYKITDTQTQTISTTSLRTMLMYNF